MAKLTGQSQRNPLVKNRTKSSKGGAGNATVTPAVRILPMDSKEEFEGRSIEDVQDQFFPGKLLEWRTPPRWPRSSRVEGVKNRPPGTYYYHAKGLTAQRGATVLFQYAGMIIASADFIGSERFEEPEGDYLGALYFEPESVEVFDPIGAPAIKKVWPKVKRLGRAKWKLDPNGYPTFKQRRRHVRKAPSR